MAMPSAKGLFHKAAIQSGSTLKARSKEEASTATAKLLKELKIDSGKADEIQKIHWTKIIEAVENSGFSPIVDGEIIPHHPFDPDAPIESANVPLLVGYTKEDAGFLVAAEAINDEGLRAWTKEKFKDKTDQILNTYSKVYANATSTQIRARIATDEWIRIRATKMAERKVAQKAAPVFMFIVEWPSPSFGGKFGAVHGVDLGLVLADPRIPIAGNTLGARKMAKIVGSSFAAFARNGNPNCGEVPNWPQYNLDSRSTMIFNEECRVENDPGKEVRLLWEGFES